MASFQPTQLHSEHEPTIASNDKIAKFLSANEIHNVINVYAYCMYVKLNLKS